MKNLKKFSTWSAIVVAIGIILFMSMLMIYFIEKIVPTAKNIKWVENWTAAYYKAQSWVEEAMLSMARTNPAAESNLGFNSTTKVSWYWYSMTASWKTIPASWKWNSYYDANFSRLAMWEPLQILIWKDFNFTTAKFYFRIPAIKWTTNITLSWWTTTPIINWILSWNSNSLFSSWAFQIHQKNWVLFDINDSNILEAAMNPVNFNTRQWIDLAGKAGTVSDFYNSLWNYTTTWLWNPLWTSCWSYWCTLKLSIITPLVTPTGNPIPFLEYKIDLNAWVTTNLPMQYIEINSDWYSYWFKRHIKREVRQITTSEALDFTIFQ